MQSGTADLFDDLVSCLVYSQTLKKEVIFSSETLTPNELHDVISKLIDLFNKDVAEIIRAVCNKDVDYLAVSKKHKVHISTLCDYILSKIDSSEAIRLKLRRK